jgi:hypothetical protein
MVLLSMQTELAHKLPFMLQNLPFSAEFAFPRCLDPPILPMKAMVNPTTGGAYV